MAHCSSNVAALPGLLGDTRERDYSTKLRLFNAFAAPELRQSIAELQLCRTARVLDAGCGTGDALHWLAESAADGAVIGMDFSAAHIHAARSQSLPRVSVVQGDLTRPPFPDSTFDLIWCVNTINHLRDPSAGIRRLAELLRQGGRLALGQSSLVPEMFFAWDARLERLTNEAVRRYYLDRYGLDEQQLSGVRSLVGLLRQAGMQVSRVSTRMIERVAPLRREDERYLLEAIFRATWGGERLRPYLSADDFSELARLCDPSDGAFALRRPDFHYLQSFTIVVASFTADDA